MIRSVKSRKEMIRLSNEARREFERIDCPPVAWWVETKVGPDDCLATVLYRTPTNIAPVRLFAYRFKNSDLLEILPPETVEGSFMLVGALGEAAKVRDEKRGEINESLRLLGSRKEEDVVACLSRLDSRLSLRVIAKLQSLIDLFKKAKGWQAACQLITSIPQQ